MATPPVTTAPTLGTTTAQGLSDWAAPYVTNYLAKAQALGDKQYVANPGDLTAGASKLQTNVFTGLGGLTMPSNLGQSFSSTGAYQAPNTSMGYAAMPIGNGGTTNIMGGAATPTTPAGTAPQQNIAQQYMNPYLQSVLTPQLEELRRQNDITQMNTNAKLTGAGAFGGSRQAIMNAENNRNLMQEMNKTTGAGYANAFDKAMGQFNTEQVRGMDLTKLMADIGAQQRAIESEGVAADVAEYNQQRQFPYQQLQFQRDMISGLPTSAVSSTQNGTSGIASLATAAGGLDALLNMASGQKSGGLADLLKNLGLDMTTKAATVATTPAV
jgi:hypothetical protein